MVYHDAAWANTEESDDDLCTSLWCSRRATRTAQGVHGSNTEGGDPQRFKVRSQAGYVVYVGSQEIPDSGCGAASLMDWRSATIRRVCRSTFAAETMSAVDAFGAAVMLRASIMAIISPHADI